MNIRLQPVLLHLPLLVGVLCLGGVAQAQYTGPAITSPATLASAPESVMKIEYEDIKIMPGDIISIATLGAPELTTTMMTSPGDITTPSTAAVGGIKVDPKGQIELPYLGAVIIAGMTPSEAATYLDNALLKRGILVDPQVSVELMDSPTRLVTVLGEVQKPAPIPAFGHLRLLDAITACQGFTPFASHTITIRRLGSSDPITIELGVDPKAANIGNIPLLPGDTIIVPRVGNIFVVGEVRVSESFPLSSNTPITVMRAISMAGGLKYSAALSKARIIRNTADQQHIEIMLDLKKLMNGKQQDIAMISDDVLFIPANSFKATISSGGATVAASLFYGAIYATK